MNTLSIIKHVEITWNIKGLDGYSFGHDKQLYNVKTGRRIRQTINGGSYGYWIKGRYYTLNKLRPLLIRPENFNVPF